MECVNHDAFKEILSLCSGEVIFAPGGSCANVIRGLAHLGHRCALVGKVGDDWTGQQLVDKLKSQGIMPLYSTAPLPTSQAICLVTPDGQRTCRTFLGATVEMRGEHLTAEQFNGIGHMHIEGYSLLNDELTISAMERAKSAGATISFDLSSFEIVDRYRTVLPNLLSSYVDIVFANAEEAEMLFHTSPREACRELMQLSKVAVVSMNKQGCWVGYGSEPVHCPAYPVDAVDSTGAGDLFASGFLHGFLTNKAPERSAHYGALIAAAVVQVFGADIPPAIWRRLRRECS
jgi:sugar/nucleoside kinase (ribokinase family)